MQTNCSQIQIALTPLKTCLGPLGLEFRSLYGLLEVLTFTNNISRNLTRNYNTSLPQSLHKPISGEIEPEAQVVTLMGVNVRTHSGTLTTSTHTPSSKNLHLRHSHITSER